MGNKIHVLSRAVIINNNNILLAYDPRQFPYHYYEINKHFFYLPGGHVEYQESAQNAIIREISEEMGFNASVESFLGTIENAWSFEGDEVCCHTHEINLIFKIYIPNLNTNTVIPQKEEHVSFKWVNFNNLMNVDLRPSIIKVALIEWLNSNHKNMLWSTLN